MTLFKCNKCDTNNLKRSKK